MIVYFKKNNKVVVSEQEIEKINYIDKKEINKKEIYYHYKNKKAYQVLDFCSVKINEEWVKAVIYQSINSKELFVREIVSFSIKFS